MSRLFLIAAVLAAAPAPAPGAATMTTPGSGGGAGAVLAVAPGGRAQALGEAFTALGGDSSAVWWNPAGLARIPELDTEVLYRSVPEFSDMRTITWSAALPIWRWGVAGAGLTYLDLGTYEERSASGRSSGPVPLTESAYFASWASANPGWAGMAGSWGVTGAVALDALGRAVPAISLGELATIGPNLAAACVVRNAGMSDTGDLAPLTVGGGAAWRPRTWITGAADVDYSIGSGLYHAGAGIEVTPVNAVSIRAGYRVEPGNGGPESLSGLTWGFGLRAKRIGFNFAALSTGGLSGTSRFSLTWGRFQP